MSEANEELLQVLRGVSNILNQDNYDTLALKAEGDLTELAVWGEAVDPGFGEGAQVVTAAESKTNQKARAYIIKHVSEDILNDVKNFSGASGMLNTLSRIHGRQTLMHTVMLIKQLGRFDKPPEMSMSQYIRKVQDFCSKQ